MEKALTSHSTRSPRDAWMPFTLEKAVDQYVDILFGN